MDDRPKSPKPVSELVEDLVRRLGLATRAREKRVFEVWNESAGEVVAAHARPVMISDGQLIVNVCDSVWLQEIQFMKAELKSRLNKALDGPVIRDIRFRQGPCENLPVSSSAPSGKETVADNKISPDDPAMGEARRATEVISDPILRQTMLKVLTRKPPEETGPVDDGDSEEGEDI